MIRPGIVLPYEQVGWPGVLEEEPRIRTSECLFHRSYSPAYSRPFRRPGDALVQNRRFQAAVIVTLCGTDATAGLSGTKNRPAMSFRARGDGRGHAFS